MEYYKKKIRKQLRDVLDELLDEESAINNQMINKIAFFAFGCGMIFMWGILKVLNIVFY